MKKTLLKIIKWTCLLAFVVALIGVTVVTVKGYTLYKDTMAGVDLEEVFHSYESQENYIHIDQVSKTFTDALVAVEDHRFYQHKGLDEVAFLRAVIRNISEQSYAAGGSTITQQLSKNLFFSFDKNLERKIAELIVAKKIEKTFSKDEILEMYINVIYYGDGYVGIEAAAQGYFAKTAADLSYGESIILAGLPQAPSVYALREHLDRGIERGYDVVAAMIQRGYITEGQAEIMIEELKAVSVKALQP